MTPIEYPMLKMTELKLSKKVLTHPILGASSKEQIIEKVKTLENKTFTKDELERIDQILSNTIL